jgi:hypothetical protein
MLAIGGGFLFLAVILIEQKPSALIPALISMSTEIGLSLFGLTFIGLWFYLIWRLGVWVPGVTVSSFILKSSRLEIRTPQHGAIALAISDIVACKARIARRSGINSSGRLWAGGYVLERLDGCIWTSELQTPKF